MRTNLDLTTHKSDDADITRADFLGYFHPREIVRDPELTIARKRALLARWLSDANALPNIPAIRRSPAGVTATVDDLQYALEKLDDMVGAIPATEMGHYRGQPA
jgi:hypothetical protein